MLFKLTLASGKTIEFEKDSWEDAIKVAEFRGRTKADLSVVEEKPAEPTPAPEKPAPTVPTPPKPKTPEEAFAGFVAGGAVAGEAPPTPTAEYTQAQLDDYNDYLAARELYPNLPAVKDIDDFLSKRDDIISNWDDYVKGYTNEDLREFNTWKRYASAYGEITDWYPTSFEDWLNNYDKAQEQLSAWQTIAEEAAIAEDEEAKTAGYSDDQIREYNEYRQWASRYGDPGDWMPVSIEDYYNNQSKAQDQLRIWKSESVEKEDEYTPEQRREYDDYRRYASAVGTADDWFPVDIEDFYDNYREATKQLEDWKYEYEFEEARGKEAEFWALTPQEAARRREKSYWEEQEALKERYKEPPMYSETFASWVEGGLGASQALKGYIESKYPSLQAQYEAGQPRLTGFPTREEARAEAERRERGFAAWLSERTPELEQGYYAQRPGERGERLYMQAPTTRYAGW